MGEMAKCPYTFGHVVLFKHSNQDKTLKNDKKSNTTH